MLKVSHNAGFFSCCTIKLTAIINFYNDKHILPIVDSNDLFELYKLDVKDDISTIFFKNSEKENNFEIVKNITFNNTGEENQFSNYKNLNYDVLIPFVNKYFKLTKTIIKKQNKLINKYGLDLDNTCAIFYRGNDKIIETTPPSYDDFIKKVKEYKNNNPNIKLLLQTDEKELKDRFFIEFPETINFNEIPTISKTMTTVAKHYKNDSNKLKIVKYFLASINILSKCKNVISTSGNCEMWIALFRGNAEGIIQYLQPNEYIYGIRNSFFNPDKKYFWIN
jgi:hypothetical protein